MYVAVVTVYAMAFLVPIILGLIMKFLLKSDLGIFDMVCLYGYSLSVYVIVLILCIIPYNDA
jgi:hypothetical protein